MVLGSTEHFTMVGKLRIHKIRKKGGIVSYLYRQNKGRGEERNIYWEDSNLQPIAWASNSGEEKDS